MTVPCPPNRKCKHLGAAVLFSENCSILTSGLLAVYGIWLLLKCHKKCTSNWLTFPSISQVIRFNVHIHAKRKVNKRLTQMTDFLLPSPSQTHTRLPPTENTKLLTEEQVNNMLVNFTDFKDTAIFIHFNDFSTFCSCLALQHSNSYTILYKITSKTGMMY